MGEGESPLEAIETPFALNWSRAQFLLVCGNKKKIFK